ncbi:MAG: sigma-70 family RNA polymerase sigma factor [Myxococcales bacterium]|nr:sigma-70 family RNA polymerase sigma factor [Myxococcales bacterium]MCB9717685.1 sigma-70 family RNA polymerase sigma factor [Myxococcales bacterium]
MSSALHQAFVAALDESVRDAFEAHASLDDELRTMVDGAMAARGPLSVSEEGLVAHVARVAGSKTDPSALGSLRAGDLYLAAACAAGEDRALALFEDEYGRDIDLAIARSGNVNLSKDEFRQLLRNKLFVSRGVKPPKIADYAGRGDLRSWVRVTALRMIVDIVRQNNAGKEIPVESEMLGAMPAPNEDPELDYIQRVYKNEFKESLQKAFGNLTPRERNLLRHQVIHGLNIDQVGAIYRVHRTTAFRWIEKARKSLLRETRAELMSRLRVGTGELHSIMRVVQGDLDVSVRRLLVSEIEDEPGGKG